MFMIYGFPLQYDRCLIDGTLDINFLSFSTVSDSFIMNTYDTNNALTLESPITTVTDMTNCVTFFSFFFGGGGEGGGKA